MYEAHLQTPDSTPTVLTGQLKLISYTQNWGIVFVGGVDDDLCITRSLGALWAPTSSWR